MEHPENHHGTTNQNPSSPQARLHPPRADDRCSHHRNPRCHRRMVRRQVLSWSRSVVRRHLLRAMARLARVLIALLCLSCAPDPREDPPAEVSWDECQRHFDIDPTDHVVCQTMLEKECSSSPDVAEQEDSCLSAVFFPSYYRCWEQQDLEACEKATYVDCYMCQLMRPAILEQVKTLGG